jgi:hypothetical protein
MIASKASVNPNPNSFPALTTLEALKLETKLCLCSFLIFTPNLHTTRTLSIRSLFRALASITLVQRHRH